MFNHVCRNFVTSFIHSRITTRTQLHECLLLGNEPLYRFISTQNQDFTVDYLINSCGLSPESALKASKKIVLKESTTTKPDSVLSLFKTHGFTPSHISKIIRTEPRLLLASPENRLIPKLEYYNSIGISGPNLGKLLSKDVHYLTRSLEKRTIPSINFLRSFAPTDSDMATILNRLKWSTNIQDKIGKNIALLQDHGMPNSIISKLIIKSPKVMYLVSNKLNENVAELKKMGFSTSSKQIVTGLRVLGGMKKHIWDSKLDAYRSYGWSEEEVLSMFKKQPPIMGASVKKINAALDFFMNTLNLTRADISKYGIFIFLSMEKRIIPRSIVIKPLLSKGLISKKSLGRVFKAVEDAFIKRFVIKYQNEVPELLKLYQGEIRKEFVVGSKVEPEVEKF